MRISLKSHGGSREVTGTKHLISVGDQQILLDCGMFQGHRDDTYRRNKELPFDVKGLAAVILSHGHFDHSGNLPTLGKEGYDGFIYATDATRDIANLILQDASHIMAKDFEWLQKKGKPANVPLYNIEDVANTMSMFACFGHHRAFPVIPGVKCEFYEAGHILGSSVVRLRIQDGKEERTIAFTGDLGRPGMPIIKPPEKIPTPDYLIMESTYGNRLHEPIDDAEEQLAQVIAETFAKGGKVIIPSFAVGRTQELVYYLHKLRLQGKLSETTKIYVDSPMGIRATGLFQLHQECFNEDLRKDFLENRIDPFGFPGLIFTADQQQSMAINEIKEPCIIIASSGMCEAGRILHHLKNNVGDPKNTVLVVGFMAENTLGRSLADKKPVVTIFGTEYARRARVKILNTFSGHADRDDLVGYVRQLDLARLKKVFLVHGENAALENLKSLLLGIGVRAVEIVEPETEYPLFETP